MPSTLDCVICLARQSLEAARYATSDVELHRKILEKSLRILLENGLTTSPPRLGSAIHRAVREATGEPDPYYREKKRSNASALARLDDFRRSIENSSDPFETTVRLAIAGNSIDFALGKIDDATIAAAIRQGVDQPLNGSIDELRAAIRNADSILYLGDNAGEIVFDRLLVERLISDEFKKKVTFVVRGGPIVNDALLDDAEEVGITALVPTISNGSDGLGVHFDRTSPEFNAAFASAGLVIAKGLANYETLGDGRGPILPKKIAFLFKAKCPQIVKFTGTKLGDLVVRIQ